MYSLDERGCSTGAASADAARSARYAMLERCSCAGAWVWCVRYVVQDPTKNLTTSRNSGFSSSDSKLSEFAFCLAFCCKFLTKMRTDESEHQISTCVAIEYGDAHRKRFTVDDHREDRSEGFTVDRGWPHVKTCVCS